MRKEGGGELKNMGSPVEKCITYNVLNCRHDRGIIDTFPPIGIGKKIRENSILRESMEIKYLFARNLNENPKENQFK